MKDPLADKVLEALQEKNIDLLAKSGKDIDLLKNVFGKGVIKKK